MYWSDEGYLLSKNNFDENSIIVECFTLKHGKCSGIVYGGASRKNKKNFQIGNKVFLNWKAKGENKLGYFNVELIKPVAPIYFDDKKKSACILSSASILKILLPERQTNEKIYNSYEKILNNLKLDNWIELYIYWELSLIKDLGYETDLLSNINLKNNFNDSVIINNKSFKVPKIFSRNEKETLCNKEVKEALIFNKNLLIENFISPNRLKFPLFRNILENYFF
tara:strand:+ start:3071 stop:3742 length:672 start_codon:yes stop_codon:yes gene_type:complete